MVSPYYPPRSPWYAGLRELLHAFLSLTRLNRVRAPGGIGPRAFLLGLLVPGYAVVAHGRRRSGWWLVGGWVALLLVCLAWIGEPWTAVGFGLLLSVHATSILHLLGPWLADCRWPFRIVLSVMAVGALISLVYLPLERLTATHAFLPLEINHAIVVVRPGGDPGSVRRGDWIAYEVEEAAHGQVQVRAGVSLGPVLAVGGDAVEFTPAAVRVNGVPRAREGGMPTEGTVEVPADCWFIWPRLRTVRVVNVGADAIQAMWLQQALVPRSAYVGRPFRHWFLRRQSPPPP